MIDHAFPAQRLAVVLVAVSCHGALLALLVVALRRAAGRALTPRWRGALWGVVLLRLLLPGGVALPVPHAVAPAFRQEAPLPMPKLVPTQQVSAPHAPPDAFVSPEAAVPPAETATSAKRARTGLVWRTVLLLWAAGSVLTFTAILLRHRRTVRALLKRARPAPDRVVGQVTALRAALRLSVWPVVLVSPDISTPALLGAVRPKIVLPEALLETSTTDDLGLFLAHELAHVKRRDIWFSWAWCLALCLHWFNPVLWWVSGALRRDREVACDAHVLRRVGGGHAARYGHALLRVLDHGRRAPARLPAYGLAGITETFGEMKRRLEMITHHTSDTKPRLLPGLAALGLTAMLALVTLTAPAETPLAGPGPFATVTDEQVLAAKRDEAIASGDLIRACEAEMRRVKLRDAQENPWKDKIDLASVGEGIMKAGGNSANAAKPLHDLLEDYEAAHRDDADYVWRVRQLTSVIAEKAGDQKRSRKELARAIAAYPRVHYAIPSKHSKFQHLVNEMAMKIWDKEGVEAAEDYVVETWANDRRLAYFFDSPWRQRLEAESLPMDRIDALRERMGEKPPLTRVTVLLSPEGFVHGGTTMDMETLKTTLAAIPDPEDRFLAMGITTEDIPLGTFRDAQASLIGLAKDLGFDHFSDIGTQQAK